MADPGWYEDPEDPTLLRLWDGRSWRERKPRVQQGGLGTRLVDVGSSLSKTGCAVTWIAFGIFLLLVLFLVV